MAKTPARFADKLLMPFCSTLFCRKTRSNSASLLLALAFIIGAQILLVGAESSKPQLLDDQSGKVWVDPTARLRIIFTGDQASGFDAAFQTRADGAWQTIAAFPEGRVWTVYNEWDTRPWDPRWYWGEHGFKIRQIRSSSNEGSLECIGQGNVDEQPWDFKDQYSFENGAVKVVRSWHHAGPQGQSPITLASVLRVNVGTDARWMLPGIIYNDNPGTYPTRQVPHLPHVAFAKAVYEEHRFPVPFVNVESTRGTHRTYASLLSIPSKVPQAHKGDDQWWSLGLQWLWGGKADLLLLSGAVTTNGMNSMVYGHINGFDPYDQAYIDVHGDVTFEKTFYIDVGLAPRPGYAFRETLGKALQIFQPYKTESIPFSQAMDLKFQYARQAYRQEPNGAIGFPVIPVSAGAPKMFQRFIYGWVGRNLAIDYALLKEADRTNNQTDRQLGLKMVNFFVMHVRQDTPGLLFGDYSIPEEKWVGFLGLPDWPESISSRQLGEILDHLAELTAWAQTKGLPDADRWQALLVSSANFLVRCKRYHGMYPHTWYPDGTAVGWENEVPVAGSVTASGVYLVAPLAKIYRLTGDKRYLETAESALRAYYNEYGRDLKKSYAGATLDAACEDKEAGQGVLHAAMALYEVTKNPEYLEWARDAADWVLTWYYVYDVQFPSTSPLNGFFRSVGWMTVSVQNEVLDMFGNYTAPDMYSLGERLHDERYQYIARTIYEASTQTIARPGAMLGLPKAGMQYEHVTQTNYTHLRGGCWRGGAFVPAIIWPLANTLYNGEKLVEMDAFTR